MNARASPACHPRYAQVGVLVQHLSPSRLLKPAGVPFNDGVTAPQSSLDVLRAESGVASGPDLIRAVTAMTNAEIDQLAEALLAAPPVPDGAAPDHEVWPLVNARAALMSRGSQTFVETQGPAGLNLLAAMSPRDIGRNTFSDSVVRALLYSHGMVIEDPLVMAAELHVSSAVTTRSLSRRFIEAATVSLAEIEELVDARVVQTFFTRSGARPELAALADRMTTALDDREGMGVDDVWDSFEAGYIDGLTEPLRELWRRIRGGDRSPPLDLIRQGLAESDVDMVRIFVKVVAELRPSAVVDNTVDIVASALDDVRRLGGRHDVLCTSPLFARMLFLGSVDPVKQLRVHQLAHTPVPSLHELAINDLVRIRSDSEAFATWRARLSTGLERAHRLRDELGPDVDVAAAVAEVLADAREGMLREAKTSRVLGKGGLTAFIAGALGGATGGLSGGTTSGLLGAAGGLIPALAQGLLDRRHATPDFVRRHYVVFDRVQAT